MCPLYINNKKYYDIRVSCIIVKILSLLIFVKKKDYVSIGNFASFYIKILIWVLTVTVVYNLSKKRVFDRNAVLFLNIIPITYNKSKTRVFHVNEFVSDKNIF